MYSQPINLQVGLPCRLPHPRSLGTSAARLPDGTAAGTAALLTKQCSLVVMLTAAPMDLPDGAIAPADDNHGNGAAKELSHTGSIVMNTSVRPRMHLSVQGLEHRLV